MLLLVWRESEGMVGRKEAGSSIPFGERRVGSTGESVRRVPVVVLEVDLRVRSSPS